MMEGLETLSEPLVVRDSVVSMWGQGVSIAVSRGHLVLVDGVAHESRTLRLSKADRPRRITVVVESSGYISLDAIKWITTTGTSSLVLVSRSGAVLAAIGPRRLDDAKLRRAQALAPWTGADVSVARHLLATKVEGQVRVLATAQSLSSYSDQLQLELAKILSAGSIQDMLVAESSAAATYWGYLAAHPVSFARSSREHVPDRWKTFGIRSSTIARGNRRAVTLANALLNFAYALLEAEITVALSAVGLDPGLGVIHADTDGRASFSLDVLEALRPEVDRLVVGTIARRTFTHRDAVELVAGDVRLAPAFALEVAQSMSFASAVAFVVSQVVSMLEATQLPDRLALRAPKNAVRKRRPAPLTALAHTAIKSSTTVRPRRSTSLGVSVSTKIKRGGARMAHTCNMCGVVLDRRRPPFVCEGCRPEHDSAMKIRLTAQITTAGRAAFARAHADGKHPHLDPEVMARKRVSQASAARAKHAWKDDGSLDQVNFDRDVLPGIADVPISRIARALGVSRSWAALMRSGIRPTHKRHWKALIGLAKDP